MAPTRRCEHASEVILIAMACLSPWAFGAVEAWAEFGLDIGVVLLAFLWAFGGRRSGRRGALCCLPSLALAGLVLLALIQAASWPEGLLRVLSPATAALRTSLVPRAAERVAGDPGPPVPLPAATLSQDPEATLHAAAWLAAAWIVLQGVLGLSDGRAALRRIGRAVAANAAVLALYSLVQALTWSGKIYGWRASPYGSAGPFVSHNHLAAYLNLGLGLALGFLAAPGRGAAARASRGRHLWGVYAAGLIAAGIVLSLSRSGSLALAAAAVGLILWRRPRGLRPWIALGTAAGLVSALVIVAGRATSYPQRLATLLESSAYAERAQLWRDAIRAWPESPIWGTGLGSFPAAAARFFRHATGVKYTHAENEYVEWLVEGGVVGVALGIAGLAGLVRLGRRAWETSASARERALILGAAFGGISLLVQSGGDFAPHIPAVGVTAVILAGLLARPGLDAGPPSRRAWPWLRDAGPAVVELAVAVMGVVILAHGALRARAEAVFLVAGIGLHDNAPLVRERDRLLTGDAQAAASSPELTRLRGALESALRVRPNWAEGHLRLGLLYLHEYEQAALESLADSGVDPLIRDLLASPLWLHGVIHSTPVERRESRAELVDFEPIRRCLVPAARSFLEARRCCPVLALAHAELATVDFLLEGGDPGPVYAERALRLSGAHTALIALATQLAAQLDDAALASRGLRKSLLTHALDRTEVADLAAGILTPEQILRDVATDARSTLAFADRLFPAPEDRDIRRTFLLAALERLPGDPDLSPAERLALEAQIWARLEQPERARARMEAALALEPRRTAWRNDLVAWLIARGALREAHDQAVIGLYLAPDQPDARRVLEQTTEALARGKSPRSPPRPGVHEIE